MTRLILEDTAGTPTTGRLNVELFWSHKGGTHRSRSDNDGTAFNAK